MADNVRRIVAEYSAKNKAKGATAAFRRDIDSAGRAMHRMASGALALVGVGGGLYALKRGFDYVTKAAIKQEDALFLLEAALKATGEYSARTMRDYEAFAASIQQVTVYGDEEVLALMQLMKSLGVTSAGLEQATKMAIGLAAATGRDVRSMSMYIALAQQGEFTMLRRYIPALRSTTDATEQLRIVTEFAANGFKIAEAKAETASGSFGQMWNAVSDLAEVMGKPFLRGMAEDADKLRSYLEKTTEAIKKNQQAIEEAKKAGEKSYLSMNVFGIPYSHPITPEAIRKPEAEEGLPEVIRFEEPEWLKDTLALNAMTEEQKKAAASMYEMSMKARGLGDEMAREKKITQFAALAKVRYGADVAGAQAAQERFIKALKESEEAQRQEAAAQAAVKIAKEAEQKVVARTDEFAMSFRNVIASGFEASMRDADNWKEHMINMLEEVYWAAVRMAFLEPAAGVLARGLTGAMGTVLGPGIFATPAPTTPTFFTSPHGGPAAGYQHGGIATSPHLAMVGEVPEAFVPLSGGRSIPVEFRGGGAGPQITEHRVINQGSEKLEISRVEEYLISDRRIIEVTMQAMRTNLQYQRSITQVRG